jgi:general secretion pathway protein A
MNVLSYWKLSKNPFASSGLFFVGGSVEEAIARIEFLANSQRSLGILIGPQGSGKSSLAQRFPSLRYALQNRKTLRTIFVSADGCSPEDLVPKIADSLSQTRFNRLSTTPDSTESKAWTTIRDNFVAAKSASYRVMMLLDGFVGVSSSWEIVRRLTQADLPVSLLVSVDSERVYELPAEVAQLSELRIDLPAWDLSQTADYFDFAIESAQGHAGIFDAQAITRIHELSDGLPGRIRRLADLCLIAGSVKRMARISSDIVEEIEMELSIYPRPNSKELLSR